MNSKERIYNCVKFKGIDRVPCGLFGTTLEYQWGLAEHMGYKTIEELYNKFQIDIWYTKTNRLDYSGKKYNFRGKLIDPWITLYYENNPEPPFAEIDSIEQVFDYPIPGIDEYDAVDFMGEINAHSAFSICGGINAAIFHNYLYMCGQINGFCYLKTEPELAHAIITKITDFWVTYLTHLLNVSDHKIDIIENCNDFGTQRSLFISEEDFKEFFRPSLQRLYDVIKENNVLCMQHSCGAISPLIKEFIEMGADIINPIQVCAEGMKLESIISRYRNKITFYGGIDTQYLLPQGPVSKIREAVCEAVSYFNNTGGFILSGSQGFMNDIPYEYAAAMLEPKLREK